MPRSSNTVWALNDVAGQQELRQRGPSAMLTLSPQLKDGFVTFEQDFQAANLPEGKYIKPLLPLLSGTNWDNLVLRTTYKNLYLPFGLGKFEHQARQNLCIFNISTAFTKTASECNLTIRTVSRLLSKELNAKCKRVAILKKLPDMVMKTYDYLDILNKRILIQPRALAFQSKVLSHNLQKELYTIRNSNLLRREAEVTHLQPH